MARLDVVRVPDDRDCLGRLRADPGCVPAADRRGIHAHQRRAGDARGAGAAGGADHLVHPEHHQGQQHGGRHRGDRDTRPDRAADRGGGDPAQGPLVQPGLDRDRPARGLLRLAGAVHAGHAARRLHDRGLRGGQQPGGGDSPAAQDHSHGDDQGGPAVRRGRHGVPDRAQLRDQLAAGGQRQLGTGRIHRQRRARRRGAEDLPDLRLHLDLRLRAGDHGDQRPADLVDVARPAAARPSAVEQGAAGHRRPGLGHRPGRGPRAP